MKIELYKVMNALPIIKKIASSKFSSFELSYKFSKLYKSFESAKEFYFGEERKLVEKYAIKDEKGNVVVIENNQITFKTQDDKNMYTSEIAKLESTMVDVCEKISLNAKHPDLKNLALTPIEILSIEPFIEITSIDGEA